MIYKVGIATYLNNYNYGSALQAFALTEFICALGCDASVLNYTDISLRHNRVMRKRVYLSRILFSIVHPKRLSETIKRKRVSDASVREAEPQKIEAFQKFQTKYMKISDANYLEHNNFEVFVCGSDQVWNLMVPGLHDFFFLRFAPQEKRVAYAPSFGSNFVPSYNKKRLRRYLNEMSAISVRETSGIGIVRELTGRNIEQVLDPILLVGADFWREKYKEAPLQSPYLLCYFLDKNPEGDIFAEKLAKEHDLNIIWISSGIESPKDAVEICPSPLEFVQFIDQAECVITDSFHGIAFSSLLNTRFFAFSRNYMSSPEQRDRIDSFLSQVHLNSRKYQERSVPSYEMHFRESNAVLQQKQRTSGAYLSSALRRDADKEGM